LKSDLAAPPVPVRRTLQEIEAMMKKLLSVVVLGLSALSFNGAEKSEADLVVAALATPAAKAITVRVTVK
jgi:hypothetical protein